MKKILFSAFIAVLIAIGAIWAMQALTRAIDVGKCQREMADVGAIVTAIDSYRTDHGSYPAGWTVAELETVLEPDYIRSLPTRDVRYVSDGERYVLTKVLGGAFEDGEGPMYESACSYFEVRDGSFVSWPAVVDPAFEN